MLLTQNQPLMTSVKGYKTDVIQEKLSGMNDLFRYSGSKIDESFL